MKAELTVGVVVWEKTNKKYFIDCINSIREQTIQNFVLHIIVNGPIEEDLEEIINSCNSYFLDRLRIFRLGYNYFLAPALNLSIMLSDTIYYARMDDDDICLPRRFQMQIEFMNENSDLLISGGSCFEFEGENVKLDAIYPIVKVPENRYQIINAFHYKNPFIHSTIIFRKTFFDKVGLYNFNYPLEQDFELWLRSIKINIPMKNLCIPIIYYRMNGVIERRYSLKSVWRVTRLRFSLWTWNPILFLLKIASTMARVSPKIVRSKLYILFRYS